jgi:N-acyl-phosphatidylethanolamine-hydrolysing phospholipase D
MHRAYARYADWMRWGGYGVFSDSFDLYFAGDTGFSQDFADTRAFFRQRHAERYRDASHVFDLALIPIGAYDPPHLFQEQHVNPEEAVQLHIDVGARQSLGIHWGVFRLTDEPLDEPPQRLRAELQRRGLDNFFTLDVGETRMLPTRQQPLVNAEHEVPAQPLQAE